MRHIALCASLALLCGCASSYKPSSYGPGKNHYRTAGERIEVRLISFAERDLYLRDLSAKADGGALTWPDQPGPAVWIPRDGQSAADRSSLSSEASGLLGTLAGAAIDAIQAQIKAEADRHEQQYRQSVSADDFWIDGRPNYAGFEVVRFVDGEANAKELASRQVFAFEYSAHDSRIVRIRPVFLQVSAAKAKVSTVGGKKNLRVQTDLIVNSSWVTPTKSGLELVSSNLGAGPVTIRGYTLNAQPKTKWVARHQTGSPPDGGIDEPGERDWPWKGQLAGHATVRFLAPQPSAERLGSIQELTQVMGKTSAAMRKTEIDLLKGSTNAAAGADPSSLFRADATWSAYDKELKELNARLSDAVKGYDGGAFTLTVIVTEADESTVASDLIKIADFVGSQREAVVNWVTKP